MIVNTTFTCDQWPVHLRNYLKLYSNDVALGWSIKQLAQALIKIVIVKKSAFKQCRVTAMKRNIECLDQGPLMLFDPESHLFSFKQIG